MVASFLDSAWEFMQAGFAAANMREMQIAFGKSVGQFGFDRFSFVHALGPNRSTIVPEMKFGHQHDRWYRRYAEQNYYKDDPSMKRLLSNPTPFAWSDMPLGTLTKPERRVRLAAADSGAVNAFVVPIEGPQRELFVVRMTSPEKKFDPQARQTLYMLGILYSTIGLNKFKNPSPEIRLSPLTLREAECLRWASEGKSDWDISEILGISQHTVHEHLERSKAKLRARTRTQAAVHAAVNGWLSNPPDKGTGIKH
ncbi:MAG TPA: autoinducer binding domain-containing protein [Rhizomicrobium sp.]|nr:autoinducer binding domain-containing protein [Rhizomicrobium sp.]